MQPSFTPPSNLAIGRVMTTVHVVELGLRQEILHVGEEQLVLGSKLFQLEGACDRFLNDGRQRQLLQARSCGRCCNCCSGGCCCACLLLWWQWQVSVLQGAECFHCVVWSVFLLVSFPISPPLPLQPSSGSLRPCRHRAPVRLPFWLLAMFVDGLAPSVSVVRCPHGSSKRSSTTSCV